MTIIHDESVQSSALKLILLSKELSGKISEAERDIAVERLDVYRRWFSQVMMQVEERNMIVILPIENISPRYRDEATSGSLKINDERALILIRGAASILLRS